MEPCAEEQHPTPAMQVLRAQLAACEHLYSLQQQATGSDATAESPNYDSQPQQQPLDGCASASNNTKHSGIAELQQIKHKLEEYRGYLAEAQEDIQQLQTQLASAKRSAAASASTVHDLQQQLQIAQQQNSQLQQDLTSALVAQQQLTITQQQLTGTKQQLSTTKQQLTAAKGQLTCMQQRLQERTLQLEQQANQRQITAEQSAAAKIQEKAARSELKKIEAAAAQQLAAMAADLDAARAAENAALADARRARAAEAARSRQLAETEEQLLQCREQLQMAGDIHSQLSRLQTALAEHKQQERQRKDKKTAAAAADAQQQRQQQDALLTELHQYKVMLSEAQEEVARLESDSRQLAALRRSSWHCAADHGAGSSSSTLQASNSCTDIGVSGSGNSCNGPVNTMAGAGSSQLPQQAAAVAVTVVAGSTQHGSVAATAAAGERSMSVPIDGLHTPVKGQMSSNFGCDAPAAVSTPSPSAAVSPAVITTCSLHDAREHVIISSTGDSCSSSSSKAPGWLALSPRTSTTCAAAVRDNCSTSIVSSEAALAAPKAGHSAAGSSQTCSSRRHTSSGTVACTESRLPKPPGNGTSSTRLTKAGMLLSATAPVGLLFGSSRGSKIAQPQSCIALDRLPVAPGAAPCTMHSRSATSSTSATPRDGPLHRTGSTMPGAVTVRASGATAPVAVPLTAALLSPRCLFGAAAQLQAKQDTAAACAAGEPAVSYHDQHAAQHKAVAHDNSISQALHF